MSYGRTHNAANSVVAIKPSYKLLHLALYQMRRRSNIMNLLSAKHTADNMFLIGAVLSNLYRAAFTESRRKEC